MSFAPLLVLSAVVAAQARQYTVSTIGGSGPDKIDDIKPCSVDPTFHRDGPANTSRFAAPTRVQILNHTVFVLDGMNGCIRSIKDGVVSSATPCCTADIATGTNGNGPQDMHITDNFFYILDSYNNQLKRAPRPFSGQWTVLAGNGSRPVEGRSDDGPALERALNEPHGMAVTSDGSGDIYIADTWSSCIRLLRNGTLTTVAGECGVGGHADGEPLNARFQHIHHVNLDPRNESELYVSDVECWDDDRFPDDQRDRPCHRTAKGVCFSGIRKIVLDKQSGHALSVTTVGGQASTRRHGHKDSKSCTGYRDGNRSVSKFNYVHGTAFMPLPSTRHHHHRHKLRPGSGATGGSDVIYVCDEDNNRIRAVRLATHEATTIAGTGHAGHTDGPADAAEFRYPGGLGLDPEGNIFVGDYESSRVRRIDVSV